MDLNLRIQRIDQAISESGGAELQEILKATGSSLPTLRRDLRYMRKSLGFPIVYSRRSRRYSYTGDASRTGSGPGAIWFSQREAAGLLTAVKLLAEAAKEESGGRLSASDAEVCRARLCSFLGGSARERAEVLKRVEIEDEAAGRPVEDMVFRVVGHAIANQRRILLRVGDKPAAEMSPLRLVLVNGGWALDVWDHSAGKDNLARIPLEAAQSARELSTRSRFIAMRTVRKLGSGGKGGRHD